MLVLFEVIGEDCGLAAAGRTEQRDAGIAGGVKGVVDGVAHERSGRAHPPGHPWLRQVDDSELSEFWPGCCCGCLAAVCVAEVTVFVNLLAKQWTRLQWQLVVVDFIVRIHIRLWLS